jgi:hypothetical protein
MEHGIVTPSAQMKALPAQYDHGWG